MAEPDTTDAVLRVIRGENHWSSLQSYGFGVRKEANNWWFHATIQKPISITANDVADGISNLRGGPDRLQEWASFLLATDLVSFDKLETSNEGEALLNGLWDLCFGEHPTANWMEVVRRVHRRRTAAHFVDQAIPQHRKKG